MVDFDERKLCNMLLNLVNAKNKIEGKNMKS